jgi:phospholipase/carboxylesterase
MKSISSGLGPLASFWAIVIALGIGLGKPPDVRGQTMRPKGYRQASPPVLATPAPVISVDTLGTWRYIEQRRLARFKVSLPRGYDSTDRRYPVVLLLHGNGNSPQMLLNWFGRLGLDSVIVVCPEAPYVRIPETVDKRQGAYTGVADAIAAPDTLRDESIQLTARWYIDALDAAMGEFRVDTALLPVVVGYSQGGFFAHVLMTLIPERISGVATICASVYPQWNVLTRFVSVPPPRPAVFVAHGRNDPIVPVAVGRSYRAALETSGFELVFREFDGGHWPTAEIERDLRSWIMSIIR